MKKESLSLGPVVIHKMFSAFFYGFILLALVAVIIWKREFFFFEHVDFSSIAHAAAENDALKIKTVRELDVRLTLFSGVFVLVFLCLFINSFFWKLEYGQSAFSLKYEAIKNLEYKKIISIVHYKAHRFRRSGINEFIVTYMGIPEFGYREEVQKAIIKYFPHNYKMKIFFNFVREQNPEIDFYTERATSEGIERTDFDYFYAGGLF